MERVYVWGLGSFYKSHIKEIYDSFEVVGLIDNNASESTGERGLPIIKSESIASEMTVLIMVKNFYSLFKEAVVRGADKVLLGNCLFPESFEEELLSKDGHFEIENREIYYCYNGGQKSRIDSMDDVKKIYETLLSRSENLERINGLPIVPFCRDFGISRGTPIDRFYIESFLEKQKADVRGTVLEIAENTYTMKYGENRVTNSMMLHVKGWGEGVVTGNLETGEGIEDDRFDCAILTQTLMFIYDVKATMKNIYRMLKPGGTALITVSGISQISRYDAENWGSYWSFHEDGIRKLAEECFDKDKIEISTYGNVKTAAAFLYGTTIEEVNSAIFDYNDSQYPVIIAARLEK